MNIKRIEAHPVLLWAYKCPKLKSGIMECFKCSFSMGVKIPETKFKIVEDENENL
jgi:hypothetical protein